MRSNTRLAIVAGALSALVVLDAAPAQAQYGYGYAPPPPVRPMMGSRHRFHGYVGGQLTGLGVIAQKTDAATGGYLGAGGGGGGLFGGLRMGPFFALELNWNITYHNVAEGYVAWSAFHLQTLELNGKIHIPTMGPVEPYVQLGVGLGFLGVSWDDRYSSYGGDYIFASGPAFNLGGGLDFWLSPFVSLGGRILYKGMRFSEPNSAGGTTYYTNFTNVINADFNFTLHF